MKLLRDHTDYRWGTEAIYRDESTRLLARNGRDSRIEKDFVPSVPLLLAPVLRIGRESPQTVSRAQHRTVSARRHRLMLS